MDNFKCDNDCDNCDLFVRLNDAIKEAHDKKQPLMMLAQLTDETATVYVHGGHDAVVDMIYNAIESDERIEAIFMHVMSRITKKMLRDVVDSDVIGDIVENIKKHGASTMPKPKAEC